MCYVGVSISIVSVFTFADEFAKNVTLRFFWNSFSGDVLIATVSSNVFHQAFFWESYQQKKIFFCKYCSQKVYNCLQWFCQINEKECSEKSNLNTKILSNNQNTYWSPWICSSKTQKILVFGCCNPQLSLLTPFFASFGHPNCSVEGRNMTNARSICHDLLCLAERFSCDSFHPISTLLTLVVVWKQAHRHCQASLPSPPFAPHWKPKQALNSVCLIVKFPKAVFLKFCFDVEQQ